MLVIQEGDRISIQDFGAEVKHFSGTISDRNEVNSFRILARSVPVSFRQDGLICTKQNKIQSDGFVLGEFPHRTLTMTRCQIDTVVNCPTGDGFIPHFKVESEDCSGDWN